jgi:DNA-binding SARP family transcriptional activator
MLRIYLTGSLCLRSGTLLIREHRMPRRQGRLAFAYLVSERDRPVPRDELAEVQTRYGDHALALRSAEEAVGLEPYRESGYQRLMRVHLAAGNRAEALRVFERCQRLLSDELGTRPTAETSAVLAEVIGWAGDSPRDG